jgi:hypothetical protein
MIVDFGRTVSGGAGATGPAWQAALVFHGRWQRLIDAFCSRTHESVVVANVAANSPVGFGANLRLRATAERETE